MMDEMRVALGMSGGVDSAVSAALLQRAGYTVVGVTCVFTAGEAAEAAVRDAEACCRTLGIQHVTRDCTDAFEADVVCSFVRAYAAGFTPSPCVACNATCKIPQLKAVADAQGCGKVATGHYARIAQLQDTGRFVVKCALDTRKDQSYMLSMLSQDQLARLIMPLGGITKAMVRLEAANMGLPVAEKPESQDICFIEGDDYRSFLQQRGVESRPGSIVNTRGDVLGSHDGLFGYTLGQRQGIGVAAARPYYVIGKHAEENRLVVGFKEESYINAVDVDAVNWQAFENLDGPLDCSVKLRYRSTPAACTATPLDDGRIHIALVELQPATAPGQIAVLSWGDTVLGGGTIEQTFSAEKGD